MSETPSTQNARRMAGPVTGILAGSLLVSVAVLIVMPAETLSATATRVLLAVLIAAVLAARPAVMAFVRRGWPVGIFLFLALLNLLIVVPELVLRQQGFSFQTRIEFGFPGPEYYYVLQPDPELFWTLNPEDDGVNELGFPGDMPAIPKPEGTKRLMILGDSCSQIGLYPGEPDGRWASYAEAALNTMHSPDEAAFEEVTLAVAGYSSHHGRILAERFGETLDPDVVVVYFGWNDHWQAWGERDSQKDEAVAGEIGGRFNAFYQASRLLQFLTSAGTRLRGTEVRPTDEVRVTEEEYRENLSAIRERFQELNVPVVFITAPTPFYAFPVNPALIDMHFAPSQEAVRDRHRRYNEIVREVAAEDGSYLLDAEREWQRFAPELQVELFMADGIHPDEEGKQQLVRDLLRVIETEVAVDYPELLLAE